MAQTRSNTKRRKVYAKRTGFKKAVTAIAKKAVMTIAEPKFGVVGVNTNFGVNGVFAPMWTNVQQGVGQNQRDGDEVRSTGINIRGNIMINPGVITTNRDYVAVRFLIVSGKRPLTSVDMPGFRDAIDREKLNVHYERYINFSTTKGCYYFRKYLSYNRKILFEGTAVNKNELYFWMIPNDASGGTQLTTTTGCKVELQNHLGFKDI